MTGREATDENISLTPPIDIDIDCDIYIVPLLIEIPESSVMFFDGWCKYTWCAMLRAMLVITIYLTRRMRCRLFLCDDNNLIYTNDKTGIVITCDTLSFPQAYQNNTLRNLDH